MNKSFISILLLIGGSILIAGIIIKYSDTINHNTDKPPLRYEKLNGENRALDITAILDDTNVVASSDLLMLFILDSEFCATCINEISEYVNESTRYIESGLSDLNIQRHALIISRDSNDVDRVKKVVGIPFGTSPLYPNNTKYDEVTKYMSGSTFYNMILFIDSKGNEVSNVIRIFSSPVEPYVKRNLIRDAIYGL
ncbi:MAG: hypothetical protein U5K31_10185 [Balneolaceae bacterium]|nr:hypothetical protein [Balneolaceae bacterium]